MASDDDASPALLLSARGIASAVHVQSRAWRPLSRSAARVYVRRAVIDGHQIFAAVRRTFTTLAAPKLN